MVMGCLCSYYCGDCCPSSYNLLHFIKSNFFHQKNSNSCQNIFLLIITFFSLLLIKEKVSDESRKKTDEPIPDVEEVSDEEQEIDTKDDEVVDRKSADEEEENVSVAYK